MLNVKQYISQTRYIFGQYNVLIVDRIKGIVELFSYACPSRKIMFLNFPTQQRFVITKTILFSKFRLQSKSGADDVIIRH